MSDTLSIETLGDFAYTFAKNVNEVFSEEDGGQDVLSAFRAACRPGEEEYYRFLIKVIADQDQIRAPSAMAAAFGGNANEDTGLANQHFFHLMIRLAEVYARSGIEVLGLEKMQDFMPYASRKNAAVSDAFETLSAPSLGKLCHQPS